MKSAFLSYLVNHLIYKGFSGKMPISYQGNFPILVWRHPFFHRSYQLTSTHFLEDFTHSSDRYIKPWYMCIYLYQFLTSTVGYQFFCTSTRTDCVFVPFSSGFPWKNWYFHRSSETFFHCFRPFQIGMWPTTCRWCKQLLEGDDDWRVPRFPVSRDRKTRDRNGDLC